MYPSILWRISCTTKKCNVSEHAFQLPIPNAETEEEGTALSLQIKHQVFASKMAQKDKYHPAPGKEDVMRSKSLGWKMGGVLRGEGVCMLNFS